MMLKTSCYSLLLLAAINQGLQDVQVLHYKTMEVLAGQKTSLPCLIENISTNTFISTEWSKKNTKRTKLALYAPLYGYSYFVPNVTLTIHNDTGKSMGTYLELPGIDKEAAGTYSCDITIYPLGVLRRETELRVKDKIECDMNNTIEVSSGENVTIYCNEFSNVTYTWSKDGAVVSEGASLHLLSVSGASAGLYKLTANTGNSRLHATFTITVFTQTTDYWADATSLLPSKNDSSDESETTSYSPNITFRMEDKHFSTATIPVSYNQTDASEGSNHSKTYYTTLNYNQSDSLDPVRTIGEQFHSEAVNTDMSYNQSGTSVPFVQDTSTDYAELYNDRTPLPDDGPSAAFTTPTSAPNASLRTSIVNTGASLTFMPETRTNVTEQQENYSEGKTHLVLVLSIIGVVLLIIVVLLYRRRVIKKRMDLPPPFKPPPPPIKYTAARNLQFPLDRCNSVTVGGSEEVRHTFI